MKTLLFSLAIVTFTITLPSISARFIPNTSSIPKWMSNNVPPSTWDTYNKFTNSSLGKTYNGLSKLKKYFHHFGYIPNVPLSNFTDEYDEVFEYAIRAYQKNFNLNITGKLDDATMNQLVLPRCGVADIINGTTSMNSGKSNTINFHTVAHYSFLPDNPRWPNGTKELTYAFDPKENLDETTKQVFANAFDRWSKVITITFRETTSFNIADIKIGFYSGDHGDGDAFDGISKTLAHASGPNIGRFHLDKSEDWVVNGDVTKSPLSDPIDLESVAVHEIGHLLGLGHSSVEEAIMYPTIASRTRKVELANDDVEGIQQLYSSNPNFTTTSATTSTTTSRDTSHGDRHMSSFFFSMFFFGFVCMIL